MGPETVVISASAVAIAVFLGVLLLIAVKRRGKKSFSEELSFIAEKNELEVLSWMEKIESRLEEIIEISETIGQRVASLEHQVKLLQGSNAKSVGAAVMPKQAGMENISRIHEEIYRAYDCGMQINELARKFGRGKGEIELILNLRKMMA